MFERRISNPAIAGLFITALLLAAYAIAPKKRLLVHPVDDHATELYGFTDPESGRSARWLDRQNSHWVCDYQPGHPRGCGWSLLWKSSNTGIDFHQFDSIELALHYVGPASRVRVYLRNFNDEYAQPADVTSTKFMSMSFPAEDAEKPLNIGISEFFVASWWLKEFNVRRQWSRPEFDNIVSLGVDFVEPGLHELKVERIVLLGEWISLRAILIFILGGWITAFLLEGGWRLLQVYRATQRERSLIKDLEYHQHNLEAEQHDLRLVADTDPLTGILNRAGLDASLQQLKRVDDCGRLLGLVVLDLDHFKRINDAYGHDMGDKVLKAFAAALSANLRHDDVFARWGGEAFVVVCQNRTFSGLCAFAEKLREISTQFTFGADFDIKLTVSIGVATLSGNELFEAAFRRADTALRRAKINGRNRVEYEPTPCA